MKLAERIALTAESKVGVREQGGPNKGPGLAPFFAADWHDPNGKAPGDDGYPWCAAFCCWVVQTAATGIPVTFAMPRTPSAYGFAEWSLAQDNSTHTKRFPGRDVRRGDLVIFDKFSHIGVAVSPPDSEGWFETVEGNTNAAGSREGDGVYRKRRNVSQLRWRIRFTK